MKFRQMGAGVCLNLTPCPKGRLFLFLAKRIAFNHCALMDSKLNVIAVVSAVLQNSTLAVVLVLPIWRIAKTGRFWSSFLLMWLSAILWSVLFSMFIPPVFAGLFHGRRAWEIFPRWAGSNGHDLRRLAFMSDPLRPCLGHPKFLDALSSSFKIDSIKNLVKRTYLNNCAIKNRLHMKPRRTKTAIASLICNAGPFALSVWAFSIYFFGPATKRAGEDVLGYSLICLWMLPLAVGGVILGACARGYRLACIGVSLVSFVRWASIIVVEGGLW